MGNRRRAGVIVVVVIAIQVYNNNFSFSPVFVTIRENKITYLQARGCNAPEPSWCGWVMGDGRRVTARLAWWWVVL